MDRTKLTVEAADSIAHCIEIGFANLSLHEDEYHAVEEFLYSLQSKVNYARLHGESVVITLGSEPQGEEKGLSGWDIAERDAEWHHIPIARR